MTVTVTDVRKALEDMVYANLIDIYMIKHGTDACIVGDNSIAFPVIAGYEYDSADDYIIEFYEALDTNGIDIRPALVVKDKTVNGFTVYTPRATTIKWTAMRKTPKINFWT